MANIEKVSGVFGGIKTDEQIVEIMESESKMQ
jgi:hypothetical protein